MRRKKLWFTLSAILAVLGVALTLPTGAVAASKYKVLHRFTGKDGLGPYKVGLIFDTTGTLYGTTSSGSGTVFALKPNGDGSWTESVLYSFTGGADGGTPFAGLIFDAAGNLYGTTWYGGSNACESGCGVVFKLKPNSDGSWTESVLHAFTGADGRQSEAGLIFDAAGNLYGTTQEGGDLKCGFGSPPQGCGVVFELTPKSDGTWTESVLHSFLGGVEGQYSSAGLIFDAAGNLYSTTFGGGSAINAGTVFKLAPNSNGKWTERVLHSFDFQDGFGPSDGVIRDSIGNLYGTTYGGGSTACDGVTSGCGIVFKLTPGSGGAWREHVLHRFTGGNDGANPVSGLIFDAAGNLYGTTEVGGAYGYGVVFELMLTSGGWRERVLHAFVGKPATYPFGGLILDKAGNVYGTTYLCGSGEGCQGVVFEISP